MGCPSCSCLFAWAHFWICLGFWGPDFGKFQKKHSSAEASLFAEVSLHLDGEGDQFPISHPNCRVDECLGCYKERVEPEQGQCNTTSTHSRANKGSFPKCLCFGLNMCNVLILNSSLMSVRVSFEPSQTVFKRQAHKPVGKLRLVMFLLGHMLEAKNGASVPPCVVNALIEQEIQYHIIPRRIAVCT
eukprot:1335421-Amphidinium_carterae.1